MTLAIIALFSWALASPEHYFFPGFANTGADDATYVAYAMSIAFDGDLDFSNEIADRLIRYPNGRVLPVHPLGPGIMAAPVVSVLSLGDRLSGHPVVEDRAQLGGSWSYLGYFIASAGALIGGLLLASRTALAMSTSLSPRFLLLILAGTGLPFYGLMRFTMGHSFEFFAASLVLWGVVRLHRQNRDPLRSMLLIGAGVTFSLLVRPANVNILLLPVPVHLILQLAPHAPMRCRAPRPTSGWLAGGTALGLAGTFGVNAFLYGTPYPSFRQQYGSPIVDVAEAAPSASSTTVEASSLGPFAAAIEFVSDTTPRALTALSRVPDISTVIFTQEYGLLWFMPIVPIGGVLLLVSLGTLWRRYKRRRSVALVAALSAAYVAVPLGVVLVWQSHASSFGFRYLFSLVPLGLLGLALWSALPERPRLTPLRPILGLLALLATFSLLGQVFHGADRTLALAVGIENSFGRFDAASNRTFAKSLISALLRPEAWANMLARGLPGFVALVVLPLVAISAIGTSLSVVPLRRADTLLELVTEYRVGLESAAPGTILVTVVAFGVLVPAILAWMIRRSDDPSPPSDAASGATASETEQQE